MNVHWLGSGTEFSMNKKYIRKATRVGQKSIAVVIPAAIVDTLNIRERQKLVVELRGKTIHIKDWKK
jgi:antitoxin component of MazEF toxin-antitoxin module